VFSRRRLSPLFLLLSFVSCTRTVSGPPPAFAFVRFENLSGDGSLEWLGRAASEVLPTSLMGALEGPVIASTSVQRLEVIRGNRPADAPGISAQRASLILAGARRMVSGYVEKTGTGIRIQATEEDIATGKTIRILSARGPATVDTLLNLARQFSPKARTYLTNSTEALRLYNVAMEVPGANAGEILDQAIAADPSFGPAYIAAARVAASQNRRDDALKFLDRAQAQKLDPLSLATAKLDKAVLTGDDKGRIAALKEVVDLNPADTSLLRQLAESKSASGDFAEAAAVWQKLSTILRDDVDVWNQVGYNRAWSGDYPGALAAMREYARARPKDANPFDSTGDIHFMYRKYGEAAASYLESFQKDPSMQAGASLYKAAWAKFYAGDRNAGDKLMDQLRSLREKAGVTNFQLFQADWLYRTGRQKEGIALLRKELPLLTAADAQAACYEQLVVWDLLAGDRDLAAKDAQALGPPKNALAAIARFIAQPSAPAAEWEKRANLMFANPALTAVRRLALGYALLLDGKRQEALPVWQQIVNSTPPGDFAMRAVYTRLKGEKEKLAVLPTPNGVNQFAALFDKL